MTHSAAAITRALKLLANEDIARVSQGFFKTGKGEYGEGDKFLGIKVPEQRRVAKAHREAPLSEIEKLLHNQYHEVRLVALLILVMQYERAAPAQKKTIFDFYLGNTTRINNWDMVDLTAPNIVGAQLGPGKHALLTRLAKSKVLWERRIAIIATLSLIRQGYYAETLRLASILMRDEQDLIHKAVGWMLREVGNRDLAVLRGFLDEHAEVMPRTALRYALEKMGAGEREKYMKRK